jgi:hypothetical protein
VQRIDNDLALMQQSAPQLVRRIAPDWKIAADSLKRMRKGVGGARDLSALAAAKIQYFDQFTKVLDRIDAFHAVQVRMLRTDILGARLLSERRSIGIQVALMDSLLLLGLAGLFLHSRIVASVAQPLATLSITIARIRSAAARTCRSGWAMVGRPNWRC